MHRSALSTRAIVQIGGVCLGICVLVVPHYFGAIVQLFPHSRFVPVYLFSFAALFGLFLWHGLRGNALVAVLRRRIPRKDLVQLGAICVALCVITGVHYVASVRHVFWHEVFQRAYYLPVIVSALWYGLRGGVLAAFLAAVLYLPHVVIAWHGFPSYQFNQYSEAALFFVFGGLTGLLSDQQRRQREKLQETAERLSEVYAELQRSFESLRRTERLSALGRLSAGLAHEIRNPLSAIEGALEIIGRPTLEPERREEFLAVIKKEFTRLNKMLDHFLEFARPRPPNRKPTDIRALMEEVCSLVSEFVFSHHVTTRCVQTPEVSMVWLDPDQIKEVILNLVLNASEAMPSGGAIELRAAEEREWVIINVKDEGVGVRDADLQQIFDPFYTTKKEGTGLGLSIAHQIMEQHGGRIEAKSNPDRGMTFSLVFPRGQPEEAKV